MSCVSSSAISVGTDRVNTSPIERIRLKQGGRRIVLSLMADEVGRRYHVCADQRGMVVPGGGAGSVQPASDWLVNE